MATGVGDLGGTYGGSETKCASDPATEDSSESDGEPEPSKAFHRRISTSKAIKNGVCIKEGFLMKQTNSFQRWKRRYFKLKPKKLYYAKDNKSAIFEEVDLTDLSIAECSTKNANHSFQVITPFRRLILCAESRKEMEEWISALKTVSSKDFYEGAADHSDLLSGQHNWYVTSHARPTYCNICREALSGVTSHGLSCEVCKFKVHKKCAVKAPNNCKWTTLASVGKDIIEDEDGNIAMPHQWLEGNLPVSAKCVVCDKTCGSVLRLQDWRCLWCKAMVHTSCKSQYSEHCPLGACRMSILPPTALHSITDDAWEINHPIGCSPLLVFVNSKSGDNQGVKFLRRFKQLLNPAQVFDLMHMGPGVGIRLFKSFNPLRILVCGGDGSVSWVLTELDKLNMHKQCQVGVLPLGTGNDLARVLGWGSVCDDDTQLPQMVEKYEKATTKLLDRWCIMTYEGTVPVPRKSPTELDRLAAFQNNVVTHLTRILHSDQYSVVISSAKVLCETVKEFIAKVGVAYAQESSNQEDSITHKCVILSEKLDSLLKALNEECLVSTSSSGMEEVEDRCENEEKDVCEEKGENEYQEKDAHRKSKHHARKRKTTFIQREALMSRANSLKKAVRQIIEHTEKAIDEQNAQTKERLAKSRIESSSSSDAVTSTSEEVSSLAGEQTNPDVPIFTTTFHDDASLASHHHHCWNPWGSAMGQSVGAPLKDTLQVTLSTIEGGASADSSPCPSPNPHTFSSSPVPSPCPSPLCSGQCSSPQNVLTPPFVMSEGSSPSPYHGGHTDGEDDQDQLSEFGSPVQMRKSEVVHSPTATRRISSGAAFKHISNIGFQLGAGHTGFKLTPEVSGREKSHSPDAMAVPKQKEFPIINPLASLPMWPNLNKDSLISKVLLANADALCAAASPLMDVEDMSLVGLEEKCVMNNYFGIGLDAKITLEFHNKREEHPEKCRSRTRNLMWYGVLGGKELLQRTFKNLEQKVQLECDGRRIPLPSLQGIVVLNIPSYGGGSNFWGGTKEDDVFYAPAIDDKILEVVAVFGTVQMAASRVMNLQHHRIAQCRSVKITIMGDEGVPVQVDGEAWVQPPGYICIVHKNKTQVLCRNRQLESTLKTWQEKHRSQTPSKNIHIDSPLSDEEAQIFTAFVDAASALARCVKMFSSSHHCVEQELLPIATQTLGFMDHLFPGGRMIEGPNIRQHVTDLVMISRQLYLEASSFLRDKVDENISPEIEEKLSSTLLLLETELKKCSESQGLIHFHQEDTEESSKRQQSHYKSLFKLRFKKPAKGASKCVTEQRQAANRAGSGTPTPDTPPSGEDKTSFVVNWGTEEVARWLDSIHMGEYRDNFIKHDIRGAELLNLERRDLKELGITKVGHIKRIQQAISDISSSVGK